MIRECSRGWRWKFDCQSNFKEPNRETVRRYTAIDPQGRFRTFRVPESPTRRRLFALPVRWFLQSRNQLTTQSRRKQLAISRPNLWGVTPKAPTTSAAPFRPSQRAHGRPLKEDSLNMGQDWGSEDASFWKNYKQLKRCVILWAAGLAKRGLMSLRRISILPNYLYFRFLNGLLDVLNLHERGGPPSSKPPSHKTASHTHLRRVSTQAQS